MSRLIRLTVVLLLALPGLASVGCGPSKSEGQPNPDLKVPNVKPGRGAGGGPEDPAAKKK